MAQGIIAYTDGSTKPTNPGPSGWGMHGYLFENEKPKKGTGNPSHLLTRQGYRVKLDSSAKDNEVTITNYFDGYGSVVSPATNNVAELRGAIGALVYALDFNIESLLIFTDSRYVCEGTEKWLNSWIRRNFMRLDGTYISNIECWRDLHKAKTALENRGVKVKIQWVKGHRDNPGNIKSDLLADVGRKYSYANEHRTEVMTSIPDGYWRNDIEKHPFIAQSCIYFNTLQGACEPGVYYLGEQGKANDVIPLGTKVSDGTFSVIRLKEPDPAIEALRIIQSLQADRGTIDSLITARLDKLFQPEIYRQIINYGDKAVDRANGYQLDLLCLDEEPLTREVRPVKNGMSAVEELSFLGALLDRYAEKDVTLTITDLSPILYETLEKKSKKGETSYETKLKAEYSVGFAALPIEANYQTKEAIKQASVILTLGIDLPNRNALKRLEDKVPQVHLISWNESELAFRYATIITYGDDIGIWSGAYSNLRYITEKDA